jgi:hypothetical protein
MINCCGDIGTRFRGVDNDHARMDTLEGCKGI